MQLNPSQTMGAVASVRGQQIVFSIYLPGPNSSWLLNGEVVFHGENHGFGAVQAPEIAQKALVYFGTHGQWPRLRDLVEPAPVA